MTIQSSSRCRKEKDHEADYWKRKYKEERLVNKELGRRLRELRTRHEETLLALENLKDSVSNRGSKNELGFNDTIEDFRELDEDTSGEFKDPASITSMLSLDTLDTPPDAQCTEGKLVECFFALSLSNETKQVEKFPKGCCLPDNVLEFCWPDFEEKEKDNVRDRQSFSFMLSGYEQDARISPISVLSRSYRFDQVSAFDNCLYGCCLVMKKNKKRVSFCLISKHPFFYLHFAFLDSCSNCCQNDIKDLYSEYERITLPRPGESVRFKKYMWTRLEKSTKEDFLSDYGLATLLNELPLDQILFTLGLLLQETKVIFVCSNIGKLTRSIYGLVPLLRPFRWAQPLIPYIPTTAVTVCESPIPLLGGVQKLPTYFESLVSVNADKEPLESQEKMSQCLEDVAVVSLDTGQMHLSDSLVRRYHILKLPGLDKLYHRLETNKIGKEGFEEDYISKTIRSHLEKIIEMERIIEARTKSKDYSEEEICEDLSKRFPDLYNTSASSWSFFEQLRTTQMYDQLLV